MSDVTFRSDLPVTVIGDGCCGSDALIARTAWVIEPHLKRDGEGDEQYRRVIRSMMRDRHASPFEKGLLTVYVEAPAVVWWEWTRHRFMGLDCEDFGFSLESGRYRVLDGEFYLPAADRFCAEPSDFKPMKPQLVADEDAVAAARISGREAAEDAWQSYEWQLANGVAREVARLVLPFSIYYAGYVEAKPRTWLQFFSLRKRSAAAKYDTRPQREIEIVAEQCEAAFAERWPLTFAAFEEFGRVAP